MKNHIDETETIEIKIIHLRCGRIDTALHVVAIL